MTARIACVLAVACLLVGPATAQAQSSSHDAVSAPALATVATDSSGEPEPSASDVLNLTSPLLSDAARRFRVKSVQGPHQTDWQQQFDAASSRKASGKKKMFYGIAGGVGGILIGTLATSSCVNRTDVLDDCGGEVNAALLGGLVSAAGSGVFLWGLIEWMDAKGDVDRLEAQRPRTSLSLPLGERHTLQVNVGTRSAAALSVRW